MIKGNRVIRCCGAKPGLNLLRTSFHCSFLGIDQQSHSNKKRQEELEYGGTTCLNKIELGPIKLTMRSTDGDFGALYCGKYLEGFDTCSATS